MLTPTTLEALNIAMSMVHLPPDVKPSGKQIQEGIEALRKNPLMLQAPRALLMQLAEFVPDELGEPTKEWLRKVASEVPAQDQ
jgi:hypothetical protein